MKIDKETKFEIKELVKSEIASRPNSLDDNNIRLNKNLKILSGVLALFVLINIVLHYIGINTGFLEKVDFFAIMTLVISSFTFLTTYLKSLKYKETSTISKDVWLRRIHSLFIPIHIIGFLIMISAFYTVFESSLIKYIQFSFLYLSYISFFAVIIILYFKPKYFTNSILVYAGEFFGILTKWSAIQLLLFCLLSIKDSKSLQNPNLVVYISWFSGIILPTAYEFYKRIKASKNNLNFIQSYVLRFIEPNRILCALKSLDEIKASEIKGLEEFLKLEKEGDLNKQKALLTYLNRKHNNKTKKIRGFIIAILIFVITAICGSIVQDYIYNPAKSYIEKILDK